VTGSDANVRKIVQTRGAIGTQLDPNSCWMLLRSLETLQIRAERACANARRLADYLRAHHKIAKVDYLGFLADDDPRKAVFERQSTAPGSTFSFDIKGGEREAFAFLDKLSVCKLAVSLGGTETLICHPASTTHSGVSKELREEIGLSDALIRISVGIENPDDLIADLDQALR
jgi:methionine-gamma-lyase